MTGEGTAQPRPFLGVHFTRCGVYGRFYRNKDETAYEGLCPKCGTRYRIRISEEGTTSRFFQAHCPYR